MTTVTTGAVMTTFLDLRALVEQAPPEELPALLGKLAEAEAVVRVRLATVPAPGDGREEDRLLTIREVAEVLGVPENYVFTLARQRKIPTVRPPGLDKGERTCSPKYLRVRPSSLREWIAKLDEDKGIDTRLSGALTSERDRRRGKAAPKAARDDAGGVREARGRPPHQRQQVGDGGDVYPPNRGAAHAAAEQAGAAKG